MSARADSVRSILYALGANLAIAAAKTVAAIATGSSAMLAEAIHSFADSGNQGLLLWGMKQAKRPPSPDYPRSEEHTSELQSPCNLVCRLLLEKKKKQTSQMIQCNMSI